MNHLKNSLCEILHDIYTYYLHVKMYVDKARVECYNEIYLLQGGINMFTDPVDELIEQYKEQYASKKTEYQKFSRARFENKNEFFDCLKQYDEDYVQRELAHLINIRAKEEIDIKSMLQRIAITKPSYFEKIYNYTKEYNLRKSTNEFNTAINSLGNQFFWYPVRAFRHQYSGNVPKEDVVDDLVLYTITDKRAKIFGKLCKNKKIDYKDTRGEGGGPARGLIDFYLKDLYLKGKKNEKNEDCEKVENEITKLKKEYENKLQEKEKIIELKSADCYEMKKIKSLKEDIRYLQVELQNMGILQYFKKKETIQRIEDLERKIASEQSSVDLAQKKYLEELDGKMLPITQELENLESQLREKEEIKKQFLRDRFFFEDICARYNDVLEENLSRDEIEKIVEELIESVIISKEIKNDIKWYDNYNAIQI